MEVTSSDAILELVTVYARGARVRRVTRISDPPSKIRITGLPLAVIDDTVRVEVEGPAIATTVRAGVAVPTTSTAPEDSPELRGAKRRVALAEAADDRIEAAIERLEASSGIAADPSDDPPAAWTAIVTARRALVAARAERALALRTELAASRRELEEAERALTAITDREARVSTARVAKEHELRKYVDVELVGSGPIALHLEYLVDAARWAPSYVARIDGDKITLELRAVVAQDTGEDWTAVRLKLSTAEPARFATLPELAAQRIGRRQHEPARSGFRAPPIGAEQLYADFDRDVAPLRKRTVDDTRRAPKTVILCTADAEPEAFKQEVWDEESSAPKGAFVTPASGMPMPMLGGAPFAPQNRKGRARTAVERPGRGEGGAAAVGVAEPAQPTPLLDYANLIMAPPSSPQRGRLIAAPHELHGIDSIVDAARTKVSELALPRGFSGAWSHAYDYAFATDGAVDVRSDGAWHSIAVTGRATTVKQRHVTVPREQADAFRLATFANPLAGPLLPGPIDVYDRGWYLVTSRVEYTPPGAPIDVGLGVDPAVKVARNTEFREEATGMLRGALRLFHAIAVEVENVSGRPIELEVRERIPISREGDDDIEVTLGKIEPAWERWTPEPRTPQERLRGGYRWRLAVPAGQKRMLRAAYEVRIPAKSELVGGNRRES